MVSRKAAGFSAGAIVIVALILIGFQNCAPQQYFKAQKVDDTSSSSNSPSPSPTPLSARYQITVGEIKTTDTGNAAGQAIFGRSMLVRDLQTGTTEAFTHAMGLPVSVPASTHIHDLPCAIGGGGHYKFDYSIAAAQQSNEIWPVIAAGADGIGSGYTRVNHLARPEAQAVVIHDAAGARHACGPLHATMTADIKGGLFNNLPAGATITPTLKGNAVISRVAGDNWTVVRLSVNGLLPNTTYGSHVHSLPCNTPGTVGGTDFAGPHYKQNAAVTEVTASAANEIWTSLTTNATGHGEMRVAVNHVARPDAASIVIHDSVTPTTRLACVDLSTPGGLVSTETGISRFPSLLGTAKMERTAAGDTRVTVTASGLTANTMYTMHVHDRPCHVAVGGGHYKIDYNIAAAVESNEIWMRVQTDATGAGSAVTTVKHIARPEAYSVVLHDADTQRLACADLF